MRLEYGSNRTVWHLNCVQSNDVFYVLVLKIELFDHLTVYNQMTDI